MMENSIVCEPFSGLTGVPERHGFTFCRLLFHTSDGQVHYANDLGLQR